MKNHPSESDRHTQFQQLIANIKQKCHMKKVRVNQKQHLHLSPCFSLSRGSGAPADLTRSLLEIARAERVVLGSKSLLRAIPERNLALLIIAADAAPLPVAEPLLAAAYFASLPVLAAPLRARELGALLGKGAVCAVGVSGGSAHVDELIRCASAVTRRAALPHPHVETDVFASTGSARRTQR